MAAILDFANTQALSDSRFGIHRKSKEYNMSYICAKLCSFRKICPKISLTAPTIKHLSGKLHNLNFHSLEVVSRYHDPQLHVNKN